MKTLIIVLLLFLPGLDQPPTPADTSRPEAQAETGRKPQKKIEKQAREEIPAAYYRHTNKQPNPHIKSPYKAKDADDSGAVIGGLIVAAIATGFILMIRFNVPFGIATLINLGFHLILILLSLLGVAADKKRRANQKPPKAKNLAGAFAAGLARAGGGCASSVAGIVGVVILVALFGITTLFLYFESTVAFFIIGGIALLMVIMGFLAYLLDNSRSISQPTDKKEEDNKKEDKKEDK